MSTDQRLWSSTGSTLRPMILVLRRLNSDSRPAMVPSSVVHTGVKSFGCENRTPQLSPSHSWKRIGPCVVSAVKSGALLPMRRVMVAPFKCAGAPPDRTDCHWRAYRIKTPIASGSCSCVAGKHYSLASGGATNAGVYGYFSAKRRESRSREIRGFFPFPLLSFPSPLSLPYCVVPPASVLPSSAPRGAPIHNGWSRSTYKPPSEGDEVTQ